VPTAVEFVQVRLDLYFESYKVVDPIRGIAKVGICNVVPKGIQEMPVRIRKRIYLVATSEIVDLPLGLPDRQQEQAQRVFEVLVEVPILDARES
jgi:hypothetical protein